MRQLDRGTNNQLVFLACSQVKYKGLVDFQFVQWQSPELRQRGVAGAEIVSSDPAELQALICRITLRNTSWVSWPIKPDCSASAMNSSGGTMP